MIRNIPNKYTKKMMLNEFNKNFRNKFDYFYLPIDFQNKCNMGYAFINFIDVNEVKLFFNEFNNTKWKRFNSSKICQIAYARI